MLPGGLVTVAGHLWGSGSSKQNEKTQAHYTNPGHARQDGKWSSAAEKKQQKQKRPPSASRISYNLTKGYLIGRKGEKSGQQRSWGWQHTLAPLIPSSQWLLFISPALSEAVTRVRQKTKEGRERWDIPKEVRDNRLRDGRQHKNRQRRREMQTRAPSRWPTYLLNLPPAVACWITLHNLQTLPGLRQEAPHLWPCCPSCFGAGRLSGAA